MGNQTTTNNIAVADSQVTAASSVAAVLGDPTTSSDPSHSNSSLLPATMETLQNESETEPGNSIKLTGGTIVSTGKRKRKPVTREFSVDPTSPKSGCNGSNKKKKKTKSAEEEFDMAWICCECKEAECAMQPDAEELLICEGPCRRLFHYPCANLSALPSEDESFICIDCSLQRHKCAFCQEFGTDQVDVFKCSRQDCGFFFHEHCLAMEGTDMVALTDVTSSGHEDVPNMDKEASRAMSTTPVPTMAQRTFVCPAHECWTCYQPEVLEELAKKSKNEVSKLKNSFASKKNNTSRLVCCIECPRSFHITCIPPMARFHELAILCHEHAQTHKLPDLDIECSLQGELERKIEEKYSGTVEDKERRRLRPNGANQFIPCLEGTDFTDRELSIFDGVNQLEGYCLQDSDFYFCLPCDIKDEVLSKPPAYRHLHSNRYDPNNRPPRIPRTGEMCDCTDICDESCMNRVLYTECSGNPSSSQVSRCNCRVGPECSNRSIGRRHFKKCKIQREQGKGWGLIAAENIKRGELVMEYTGEVIDANTKEERLEDWSREHPNDPNFYIMALKGPWYIDARFEGNFARFINHSCDPNCILLQIDVDGAYRNGIYALCDIKDGDYLSYDYHFDTLDGDKFVCRCGAEKCRGTMKGGTTTKSLETVSTTGNSWEHARDSYNKDKQFVEDYYQQLALRSSLVSSVLPGGEASDELVANGPLDRFKGRVRESHIFLWRNAIKGSDFARRLRKYDNIR